MGRNIELTICRSYKVEILASSGCLDEATALNKIVMETMKKQGHQEGIGECYANEALILTKKGKITEAMKWHEKEEEIFTKYQYNVNLSKTKWNQGLLHGKLGNKEAQIACFKKSIELKKKSRIPTAKEEEQLAALLNEDSAPGLDQ